MKILFAKYEHTKIGFPGVKLRWSSDDGIGYYGVYATVDGVIKPWNWSYGQPSRINKYQLYKELARFDKIVGEQFSEIASVQG